MEKKEWNGLTKEKIGEVCLVTGGSGFVGRALIERLVSLGCKVRNFDLISTWEDPEVEFHKGDLTKYDQVLEALKGVNCVFHVAAVIAFAGKEKLMDAVNVDGTCNLLKACKAQKVSKLILTSTSSVSFTGRDLLDAKEDKTPNFEALPSSGGFYYNKTKAIAEAFVLEANCAELLTCSIRPHSIYGPRDAISWPNIITKALEGSFKFILGTGKNLTSITHVDNCVYGHLLAAANLVSPTKVPAGNAYHINDGEDIKFWELFKKIAVGMGVPEKNFGLYFIPADMMYYFGFLNEMLCEHCTCYDPKRKGPTLTRMTVLNATKHHTYSIEKAKKDFGFKPIISSEEAIKQTLKWFQENYNK